MEKYRDINIIYVIDVKETIPLYHFKLIRPPQRVQGGRGTEFEGPVKVFFKRCGIQHIKCCVYHIQAQGKIERSHGTQKNKRR